MTKVLSIVIPVYNMEKYVQKTLDSLMCDRMDDIQIIVINDGSTDESLNIINKWALKYHDTVEIIDKPNGGHGSAWNVGASHVNGKYLAFLDSDDWIYDINSLLERIATAEADLLFADCLTFHEDTNKTSVEKINGISLGSHNLEEEGLPLKANNAMMVNFHYCIYKTDIIKPLMPLFHEETSYDDIIISVAPLLIASTFEYLGLPFYVYRLGRGDQSMARSVISRKINQQERERKYAIEFAISHPSFSKSNKRTDSVNRIIKSICVTFYNYIMKLEPKQRKEYLESWTEYVTQNIPNTSGIFEYSAYKILPWPIYRISLKAYHLFNRIFN